MGDDGRQMVKSVTASFQKQHLNDKESGSDNSYTEMENPKEGSGSDSLSTEMDNPMDEVDEMESGSDNLSTEMENPMDEDEMEKIGSRFFYATHSESDSDSEFVGYQSRVVRFKKELLCNDDEDLKVVWDKKVKEVLAAHRLQCELKWDEGMMSVTGTRHAGPDLMSKGWKALYLIASGVSTQIVEPIMSGEVHCSVMRFTTDISKEDHVRAYVSQENYDAFMRQCDDYNMPDILSCYVLYQVRAIVILTKKEGSITTATRLLSQCLFGDVTFPEAVKMAKSLYERTT